MDNDAWSLKGRVQVQTDRSGSVCENLANATDSGVWVLDGSSGAIRGEITDFSSDGRWYVEWLDQYLQENIKTNRRLPDVVRAGVRQVTDAFGSHDGANDIDVVKQPLSAAAIVALNRGTMEYLLSADCNLLIRRNSGRIEVISGDGPRELDQAVVSEIQRLKRQNGLTHPEASSRTRDMIVENRRQMNTVGGYWALSMDPRAVAHARGSTLDPRTIDQLALFSDGFERLFELYEELDYQELFKLVEREGIDAPFERLREIERADRSCEQYPRVSVSDDASLAVVDVPSPNDP